MERPSLSEALARRTLLCDGGMGTQLIAAGMSLGQAGEGWNVDRPDVIEDVHRRYRDAGCELLTTNTFGGTTFSLARHGLEARANELNRAGAALARRAAGDAAWVLGDIGPCGDFLEPYGTMQPDVLSTMFREQARALVDGGADAIIVETMVDPEEMRVAVEAVKQEVDLPVIATYAFNKAAEVGFRTMMGATVGDALSVARQAGADVVGANCGTSLSLEDYQDLARQLVRAAGDVPVILQPNAGAPRMQGEQAVYDATPQAMADIVPVLLDAGVRIIGGCCGTTPDHLRAMGQALQQARRDAS